MYSVVKRDQADIDKAWVITGFETLEMAQKYLQKEWEDAYNTYVANPLYPNEKDVLDEDASYHEENYAKLIMRPAWHVIEFMVAEQVDAADVYHPTYIESLKGKE